METKYRAWYKNKMWYGGEAEMQEEQYGNFVDNVNQAFENKDIVWMQYTGELDGQEGQDRKEICIGDIVELHYHYGEWTKNLFEVVFDEEYLAYAFSMLGGAEPHDGFLFHQVRYEYKKIVGNKFENPELLPK